MASDGVWNDKGRLAATLSVCRKNWCPERRLGHSEGTISAHPTQVWFCLCPRPPPPPGAGGLALSRGDYGNCPSLKYMPSPLKVLLTAFLIFFFLYLFEEPCNFFLFLSFFLPPPLPFFFLVPSVIPPQPTL